MNIFITSDEQMINGDKILPDDVSVIYFKIVNIGPKSLKNANCNTKNIHDLVKNEQGFYIISTDGLGIKDKMYNLLDNFLKAREEFNESKN